MKILITSLLLLITLNAQNVWYVKADATGANTGRNWTDAWNYFDSSSWAGANGINWAIIQPGDTIYVSGGVDSLIYTANTFYGFWISPNTRRDFTSGNPPVISRAWQSGHNGIPRLIATGGGSGDQGILRVRNINNIKIRGLVFEDRRTSGVHHVSLGDYSGDSHYYLEDCHLIGRGNTTILYLGGYHITVRGNILEHLLNNKPDDCDIIGISGGGGSFTIDRNILIQRNTNNETTAHRDMIQISNLYGNTSVTIPITISNNLIIAAGKEGTTWNNMIYNYGWDITPPVRLTIYNNIFVNEKYRTGLGGIATGRLNNDYPVKLYALNNTIIGKGSGASTVITCWSTDSLIIKNNILVSDTFIVNFLNLDLTAGGGLIPGSINYNHYAEIGGTVGNFNSMNWTTWRAQGHDANSSVSNSTEVLFTNKYGENIEDYYTQTGRGSGVNLWNEYPFLRTDILGNPRPQTGAWDIGALQYQGNPQNNINVRGKVFLQGPFLTNSMSTSLNQGGYLPNSQPYNQPPWNYNGSESFSSGPSSNMVDWVLVELRNASNPSQVVSRRAAIVKNDGLLLRPNGNEGVFFDNVNAGQYYISIYHRNHLAIMSSSPVQLSANSSLYDFTTAMNKAYGQNPMVELSPGKFGMIAADGNADGIINSYDRDGVWLIQNGTMGYKGGDFNMNSGVTVHDVNQLWNVNNGRVSQVP